MIIAYRELRLLELEVLKRRLKSANQMSLDLKSYIKVKPEQFYGIEIDDFPARIAQTAMWLMDHQMNELVGQKFGVNIPDLPLVKGAHIYTGNALEKNWEEVVSKNELAYILGNPPFVGSKMMSVDQRHDLELAFGKVKGIGVLDYVTAWYAKAAAYISGSKIRCAFVSTNSITQGEQVGILWGELLKRGIKIHFAHKTFRWSNEARGKAAVYCVIIGFGDFNIEKKKLYEYESVKGEAHEISVKNINPYLVPGDDVVIGSRQKPLNKVPEMSFGSMPNDGGNLILNEEERDDLIRQESLVKKFIRPLIGAQGFLNGGKRYCLWLAGSDPKELKSMPEVMRRIQAVRDFRLKSKRPATIKLADKPALFGENHQPSSNYVLIPRVSSENRKYIPMGFFGKESIVGDTCMSIPNATLYHFGVLESEMHMTWVGYVCGRLKSDYRYSKDIVYNNFPWPESPSSEKIKAVEKSAQDVLDVRAKYLNNSLADLYDSLTMPADLVKAHKNLDKAVDLAYGKRALGSSAERMNFLFELYGKYVNK